MDIVRQKGINSLEFFSFINNIQNTYFLKIKSFILLWPKNYACSREYHSIKFNKQIHQYADIKYEVCQNNVTIYVPSSLMDRMSLTDKSGNRSGKI
jgi:hypothetical protein